MRTSALSVLLVLGIFCAPSCGTTSSPEDGGPSDGGVSDAGAKQDLSKDLFDPMKVVKIDIQMARAVWDFIRGQELDPIVRKAVYITCPAKPLTTPYIYRRACFLTRSRISLLPPRGGAAAV